MLQPLEKLLTGRENWQPRSRAMVSAIHEVYQTAIAQRHGNDNITAIAKIFI